MPLRCGIHHPLTPFCSHCAKWGHSYRGCPRDTPRCMYCAGSHLSKVCAEKIARKEPVPRKCVNCRYEHNANSPLCVYYPKDRKKKNAARNPSSGSLNSAPAPAIDNTTEFPTLPEKKAIISRRVPKPKNEKTTSSTERHAPVGTGAAWGRTPAVADSAAVASMARVVLRPGYAPGGTYDPWGGTSKARNTTLKSQQDTSSPAEQVPPGSSLHVVHRENISLPVPPGPHLPLCTPRDSSPAASTSVQDTEASTADQETLKETLKSLKEMIQAQAIMLQTLTALVQQMIQRNDPIIPAEQANGANI